MNERKKKRKKEKGEKIEIETDTWQLTLAHSFTRLPSSNVGQNKQK